jgi:hypothetical protein
VYLVFPLIEESEKIDLKNLEDGFEVLRQVFPEFRLSKVHGKMKPKDKEEEMQRFVKGETQMLVATTVIEVGVNVPNASVMVILEAQRFGLSQLHQLRGRVGRGADQSYCILVTNPQLSEDTRKRIDIMCETNDGFRIAEADLKLRGPGDLEGTQQSGMAFDLILTDVPCSGEGMFRKDEGAIAEWSLDHVQRCSQLQREIVGEAWQCLRPGGLLVYSTCTFNTHENEENVKWILETFDAEILSVETRPEWNITGSLLPGFSAPVSRFIPGRTRGEGLFMAAIRKKGDAAPKPWQKNMQGMRKLKVISENRLPESLPQVELTYEQALQYLRREALALPSDAPRGLLTVSYLGLPLGQVKNIGSRANNLYPKEWRIKSTHHEGKTMVLAQRTPNEQ